jgi:hypothetical protein
MNQMKSTIPVTVTKTIERDASRINLEEIADNTQKRYDAGRFAPKDEDALWRLAETWYYAMLLPQAYYPDDNRARYDKQWADRGISRAVIVMRYGASLGVLPEQAIRQIYIVEGQPSPSASLMLALAFGSGLLRRQDWRITKSDAAECTIELFGTTRAKPEYVIARFDEYKHLHKKTNWQNYPQDMLVARATSRAMRRYFPDMFGGVYCAEERVDIRADRAAGQHEDITERILAAVDEPTEPVPPPPVAPTQEPAAPVVDRSEDATTLLKEIQSADAQSDWESLKTRAAGFVGTEFHGAMQEAWRSNPASPRAKKAAES